MSRPGCRRKGLTLVARRTGPDLWNTEVAIPLKEALQIRRIPIQTVADLLNADVSYASRILSTTCTIEPSYSIGRTLAGYLAHVLTLPIPPPIIVHGTPEWQERERIQRQQRKQRKIHAQSDAIKHGSLISTL